jgi:drug/metabolite transporter (DMT)-like permease
MTYLILCILFTFCLGLLFRLFPRTLHMSNVIMVNYVFCGLTGFFSSEDSSTWMLAPNLATAIFMGALFILGFTIFGNSVVTNGLGISTAVQKISISLTVPAALLLGENLSGLQWLGLLFAFPAIWFLVIEKEETQSKKKNSRLLAAILLVAAVIEISFMVLNKNAAVIRIDSLSLTGLIFSGAGILSLAAGLLNGNALQIRIPEIWAGICLGLPNFFSIYFLNKSLAGGLPGSLVFPLLNCSVIILSLLAGVFVFGETLSPHKKTGLALAVLSILLIGFYAA